MATEKLNLSDVELVPQIAAVGRALGNMAAGLFLAHAISYQRRAGVGVWFDVRRDAGRDKAGKILPQQTRDTESWEWATGLKRREQQSARKILKSEGLLTEARRGIPARLFFLVDLSKAEKLIADCAPVHIEQSTGNLSVANNASHAPTGHLAKCPPPGPTEVSRPVLPGPANNKKKSLYKNTTTGRISRIEQDQTAADKKVVGANLEFHTAIKAYIPDIEHAVRHLTNEEAQAIADELAGNIISSTNGLRKPILNIPGWLHRIAVLSAEGKFVPNAGLQVREQRFIAKSRHTLLQKDATPIPSVQSSEQSELSRQCIADLRQILPPRQAGRQGLQHRAPAEENPNFSTIPIEPRTKSTISKQSSEG